MSGMTTFTYYLKDDKSSYYIGTINIYVHTYYVHGKRPEEDLKIEKLIKDIARSIRRIESHYVVRDQFQTNLHHIPRGKNSRIEFIEERKTIISDDAMDSVINTKEYLKEYGIVDGKIYINEEKLSFNILLNNRSKLHNRSLSLIMIETLYEQLKKENNDK